MHRFGCLLLGFATVLSAPASAQDYPSKPDPPGGAVRGGRSRRLRSRVSWRSRSARRSSRAVIIENKGGAGGVAGVDTVAKATPDGYTIGMTGPGAVTVAPFLMSVPYDAAARPRARSR